MKYFETTHGSVSWDESTQSVWIEWNGFSYGNEFQSILLQGAELLRLKKAGKVLMDTRQGSAVKDLDKAWLAEFFVQHIYKNGLKYLALVEANSVVAKMSIKRTVNGLGVLPYQQKNFSDWHEAKQWLADTDLKPAAALAVS